MFQFIKWTCRSERKRKIFTPAIILAFCLISNLETSSICLTFLLSGRDTTGVKG